MLESEVFDICYNINELILNSQMDTARTEVIKLLDKAEILEISRKNGGERYIKRFDAWTHLMTMLYAVIMRPTHCVRYPCPCV